MSSPYRPNELLLFADRVFREMYETAPMAGAALDPLSFLIFAILSQRTRHLNALTSFTNLCSVFACWPDVRDSATPAVERAIAATTWPDLKAPRIQNALSTITCWRNGRLNLDHLHGMTNEQACAYLEGILGIGRKTSSAVLLFSTMSRAVLPIDTGYLRFARRYGVLSLAINWRDAHDALRLSLPESWDALELERHHKGVKRHCEALCTAVDPRCEVCPLVTHCRWGCSHIAAGDGASPAAPSPIVIPRRRPTSFQPSLSQMVLDL